MRLFIALVFFALAVTSLSPTRLSRHLRIDVAGQYGIYRRRVDRTLQL